MKNEKDTGNLKVVKKDKDSGNPMSGVSFKLRGEEGYVIGIDSSGNRISEAEGKVQFYNMEYGSKEGRRPVRMFPFLPRLHRHPTPFPPELRNTSPRPLSNGSFRESGYRKPRLHPKHSVKAFDGHALSHLCQ